MHDEQKKDSSKNRKVITGTYLYDKKLKKVIKVSDNIPSLGNRRKTKIGGGENGGGNTCCPGNICGID